MWFKKVTELKDEDVIEHNNELSEIKITSNGQAIYTKKPEAAKGQSTSTDFISVDAIRALRRFSKEHELDPNLPLDELDEVDEVLKDGNAEKGAEVERVLLEENSPYPEVRATVRNYDEDLPANTIRAWAIGLILATLGSGINSLLSLRQPTIVITSFAIQLIAYPLGRVWDRIMPDKQYEIYGAKFNLKPGRFNYKEHTVIVVMANSSFGGGAIYSTDVLVTQMVFYGQNFGWAFQLLFAVTNQMLGYGLAGVCRRWLVWPAAMIWPTDLVNCALMYTLHDHGPSDPAKTNGWSISRYRWFLYLTTGAFCWYWIPGWLFKGSIYYLLINFLGSSSPSFAERGFLTGLSYFTVACWIAPQNPVVNQIFGGFSGLGLLPITFDWTVITGYLNSPLVPPWYAIANVLIGCFVFIVVSSLGVHYSGAWYAEYFPMQDSQSYDNTGHLYNVSRILNSNLELNETLYKAYSPIFLSTNFALSYGISFATMAAVVVQVALYERNTILRQWKLARDQEDDIHMKLMKKYQDAPDWWYGILFVVTMALSFTTILAWSTHLTWWALIICMIIPVVWVVPIGMIFATTNVQIGLNVFTEFLIGYMTPGRPLATMMFKSYGYIVAAQALGFLQDLKLGHYLKVPPKVLFSSQCVATLWCSIVQIAVMNWALGNIKGICTLTQPDSFICPGGQVFFTSSIIWGAIGPARFFSPGSLYSPLLWYFLMGAVLPFITYFTARRWPKGPARYLRIPVMLGGLAAIPPATVYNYLSFGVVGFVFQRVIRNKYPGWWSEYNYITSAALTTGLILCTLVIFFTLIMTNAKPPQWWGNVHVFSTMDRLDLAIRKSVPKGQTIGPKRWA